MCKNQSFKLGPELKIGIYFAAMTEHPDGGVLLVGGLSEIGFLDTIFWLQHSGRIFLVHPKKYLNVPL